MVPTPTTPRRSKARIPVFISYRRAHAAGIAGRIYDRLTTHFGEGRVFKDVDSIPLDVDFSQHLMEKCNI